MKLSIASPAHQVRPIPVLSTCHGRSHCHHHQRISDHSKPGHFVTKLACPSLLPAYTGILTSYSRVSAGVAEKHLPPNQFSKLFPTKNNVRPPRSVSSSFPPQCQIPRPRISFWHLNASLFYQVFNHSRPVHHPISNSTFAQNPKNLQWDMPTYFSSEPHSGYALAGLFSYSRHVGDCDAYTHLHQKVFS